MPEQVMPPTDILEACTKTDISKGRSEEKYRDDNKIYSSQSRTTSPPRDESRSLSKDAGTGGTSGRYAPADHYHSGGDRDRDRL